MGGYQLEMTEKKGRLNILTDHKISMNNQYDASVKEIHVILSSYLSGKKI